MGELVGDAGPKRAEPADVEMGVTTSEGELAEPEDAEETEADRPLPKRVLIGMGSEGLDESERGSEDILLRN